MFLMNNNSHVILCQTVLLANNKTFDDIITMTFYDVILYFRLKKVENPNFFVFHPILLKFKIVGNFEILITKSKPKLKLENNLSKKLQFSTDSSQNFTEHPSTIALPWQ